MSYLRNFCQCQSHEDDLRCILLDDLQFRVLRLGPGQSRANLHARSALGPRTLQHQCLPDEPTGRVCQRPGARARTRASAYSLPPVCVRRGLGGRSRTPMPSVRCAGSSALLLFQRCSGCPGPLHLPVTLQPACPGEAAGVRLGSSWLCRPSRYPVKDTLTVLGLQARERCAIVYPSAAWVGQAFGQTSPGVCWVLL